MCIYFCVHSYYLVFLQYLLMEYFEQMLHLVLILYAASSVLCPSSAVSLHLSLLLAAVEFAVTPLQYVML